MTDAQRGSIRYFARIATGYESAAEDLARELDELEEEIDDGRVTSSADLAEMCHLLAVELARIQIASRLCRGYAARIANTLAAEE